MSELAFSVQNEEVYIKVFINANGYEIESYMQGRKPGVIKTRYRNSEYFSNKTEWNQKTLLVHGLMEEVGLIVPMESLN